MRMESSLLDPSPKQLKKASSLHVLAFSSLGELLVVESEGDFSIGIWEQVHAKAEQVCCGEEEEEDAAGDEDVEKASKDGSNKEDMLRSIVQEQVTKEQRWKQSLD